jgi:hypothetical protein
MMLNFGTQLKVYKDGYSLKPTSTVMFFKINFQVVYAIQKMFIRLRQFSTVSHHQPRLMCKNIIQMES